MAERLHPGVYVEEVSGGVKPIEGVSTSTAAFIGEAGRGIPGLAQFVTSFADFERAFGGYAPGDAGILATAVDGFFAAGGARAYVVRVLPDDAIKAEGDPVVTSVGGATAPNALEFVAHGAGKWADAIRINIVASRNFPKEAFTVEILWSDGGAATKVESYEDVRMDPQSEDYVVERMKSSRYVEVIDLFAQAVDAAAGATLVAAQSPTLTATVPVSSTATYLMYDGKVLTASWWDASNADSKPASQSVTFNQALLNSLGAGAPKFTNGSAQLTAIQLGTLLNGALTSFNVPIPASNTTAPSIGLKVGKAPTATIDPVAAATTWDLSGQKIGVTVNGTALPDITVTAVDPTKVTPAELQAALTSALASAGVGVALNGTQLTLTGVPNDAAVPTLVVASKPTAARLTVGGSAGTQGIGASKFDGLRLSLTESSSATAPALLRTLGFAGLARGYAANSPLNPLVRPVQATGLRLIGGTDGTAAIDATDYEGDARERTGLHALDGVDVNIVALPGKNDVSYIAVGIAYCDQRGDCFFLADGPGGSDRSIEVKPDDAKQFVEGLPARSMNSAMFYPWIQIPDPTGVGRNPTRFVPPSGHVAGIFARTDVTRGVWKAPAGIEATVPEAVGLQYQVIDAEQDLLNPVSLNCLRQFPNVGIVSWGSRTLSADPEWRYVPVRRMGLFLKESLRRGLQWAVFEPNDNELWGRITINIKSFMMTLFRQGAFQGTTPDDAFSVVCDASTNPQENIDAGIVTASVAFAPLKPAEFVVIQISQKSLLVS